MQKYQADNIGPAAAMAGQLARDLAPIGTITLERRLSGFAVLEDGVMFAYVDADATPYLRATIKSAHRFHILGSHKHAEMPYWSIPQILITDLPQLRDFAYAAADAAHLAFSFDIDDNDPIVLTRSGPLRSAVKIALLAA